MPLPRILQTTTFRLVAVYVFGFAAALVVLGIMVNLLITAHFERRLDARLEAETQHLAASYRSGGLAGLTEAVHRRERSRPGGVLGYAVISGTTRVAGNIEAAPSAPGWSDLPEREASGETGRRRVLVTDLGNGVKLAVAADQEEVDELKQTIFDAMLAAFAAVLVLGIAGGVGLSVVLLRRVEAIRRTAQAITAGDLTQRIPIRGTDDDFDRLSQTLNRMLDQIGELMTSLRQVSAEIAHDLKTPLARLRRRLESAQARPGGPDRESLEQCIAQVDEILATFSALLRIAQIEAGTRRTGFSRVDLSAIFETVADAFAPAAEDGGKTLRTSIAPGLETMGDRELITQMLANAVENAIRHNGPGTRITVNLRQDATGIVGDVADDGTGVPAPERVRIFDRFHRLPQSRDIPGSGLGLSLVKAVADLHGIALAAEDARPGLRLAMRFPAG